MVEGKRVRLEHDQANAARGNRNKRWRMSLWKDGSLLNAEIVKQGYGHALTRCPFSRMEEFRQLEREAREQRWGLWDSSR